MYSKIKISVLVFLFVTAPVIASATCCPCSVIDDPWSHLRHAAMQSLANLISSTTGVELDAEEERGRAAVMHQKAITATVQKTSEGHINAYAASLKQHAMALATKENSEYFSPLSHSSFGCCLESEGVGITIGDRNRNQTYQDLYNSVANYNKQAVPKRDITSNLFTSLSGPSGASIVDSSNIFPAFEATDLGDSGILVENIAVLTNPDPYPILTQPTHADTPSGEAYHILRKIKAARIAVPQQALTEIAVNKTAVYHMPDWGGQINQSITSGASPYHPYMFNSTTLSADGVLALQTEARYANPSWLIDLHRKTEVGLLRELAIMKAVNLEFSRRQLQAAKKEVYARAAMVAQKVNIEMEPILQDAFIAAHVQQGNPGNLVAKQ